MKFIAFRGIHIWNLGAHMFEMRMPGEWEVCIEHVVWVWYNDNWIDCAVLHG